MRARGQTRPAGSAEKTTQWECRAARGPAVGTQTLLLPPQDGRGPALPRRSGPKGAGTPVRNQPHAKGSSEDTLSKSSFFLTFMIFIAF